MIKNIKFFINNNEESFRAAKLIKDKFASQGFNANENNYDLAIAIGGDGAFLRMVKKNNFNSNIYYIGINSGTLGFMQEVSLDEVDKFIEEIKTEKYKVEDIGIQETTINSASGETKFYSLNEIIIRDINLKLAKLNIYIDDDLLEKFIGDGVLIASSMGSTAHNLSYGGSIVYNTFTSLQITPIACPYSKVYHSLVNSVIIPDKKIIKVIPENKDLLLTIDGENKKYYQVEDIKTTIDDKKIKCLRLSHYNFPQKINDKLLGN